MATMIFLNKWNNLYHLMLTSVSDDGENSRRLDSRYARSLEQARNRNPSSRWANHSLNVVCFMPIFRTAGVKNKKEHRVMVEQGRG